MESLIVPSSIQRIRSFLVEMCGMKVKPWAGTEETLGALHATLVARSGCDMFWTSLRVLLETLARDLKGRQDAVPGTLVDNEVLDGERYATLIDEIRAALARQAAETRTSTFRRLASALSAPALGLLLFLGGAAGIGCARAPFNNSSSTHDAATPGLPDANGSQPETKPDGPVYIVLPDTRPTPDTAPAADANPPRDAVTTGPDGGTVTIQDIMDSCNISSQQQGMILGCLAMLDSSWRDGIAAALAGQDCAVVVSDLVCSPSEVCIAQQYPSTFDPSYPRICQPVLVYIGVRFV
jgi:hypothetical protein